MCTKIEKVSVKCTMERSAAAAAMQTLGREDEDISERMQQGKKVYDL